LPDRKPTGTAVAALVNEIRRRCHDLDRPFVVAVDGVSGAGKSTFCEALSRILDVSIIPLDDFYSAHVPDACWDEKSDAQRALDVLDWNRIRREALAPLRAGRGARWQAFDFAAGARIDGTYGRSEENKRRLPSSVIVIDGAYSGHPKLADIIDMTVLLEVPDRTRTARLAGREDPRTLQDWFHCWGDPEAWYMTTVRPRTSFDLVITTE